MSAFHAQLAMLVISAVALLLMGIIAALIFEPDELPQLRERQTTYVYLVPVPTSQRPVMWQSYPTVGSS